MLRGTKGLSIRPRCIGTVMARTQRKTINQWVSLGSKVETTNEASISRSPAVVARSPPPTSVQNMLGIVVWFNDASSLSEDLEDYGCCQ